MCADSIRFSKKVFLPLDSVAGIMPTPESKDKTEGFPNVFLVAGTHFRKSFKLN